MMKIICMLHCNESINKINVMRKHATCYHIERKIAHNMLCCLFDCAETDTWNTQRKHNAQILRGILPIIFLYYLPCNSIISFRVKGKKRWIQFFFLELNRRNECLTIMFIRFICNEHEYLILGANKVLFFCF